LLSVLFGYFYFDRKFSPDENYLQVNNESGKIPMKWETEKKSAMLLPIPLSLNFYRAKSIASRFSPMFSMMSIIWL